MNRSDFGVLTGKAREVIRALKVELGESPLATELGTLEEAIDCLERTYGQLSATEQAAAFDRLVTVVHLILIMCELAR